MKTINVLQGSDAWLLIRKLHDTASEAPAALGQSKYTSRTELLSQKHTGISKDIDGNTQILFTKGHNAESLALPFAEKIIGDDLSPVTGSIEIDGLNLLASFDGINLDSTIIFEHKLWSESLASDVKSNTLKPHYTIQLDQQLLVSGASRALFMTSDGTEENMAYCWYEANQEKFDELIAGWKQFNSDLESYVPTVIIEKPKAQVVLGLPALFIHAKGEITTSNMQEYGEALAVRLAEVRAIVLVNDQDFANANNAAKLLRENIQQAKLAKDAMLSQTVTVGEAARMIDSWCEDMRLTALQLEKDVCREDTLKKQAMIFEAKDAWNKIVNALYAEIKPIELAVTPPDFITAIKGKRTYASMVDAINTLMAQKTIEANNIASDIRAKQSWLMEHAAGYAFLFADLQNVIYKASDYFQLLVNSRIQAHQETEAKKLEAERARIQAHQETEAKKLEAERARIQADEEAKAREKIAKEAKEIADAEAAQALNDHVPDARKLVDPLIAILKTVSAEELREAVVQQQDIISSFFDVHKINPAKYHEYRAVITEFIKHQQVYERE